MTNDERTTAVPVSDLHVTQTWPGEYKAEFRDWEGRWQDVPGKFPTRRRAKRAAINAWIDSHIP